MKLSCSTKLGKLAVLTLSVMTFNEAFAQRQGDWRDQYQGQPQFRIQDAPRIRALREDMRIVQESIAANEQETGQKSQRLTNNKRDRRALNQSIPSLRQAIQAAKDDRDANRAAKTQAQTALNQVEAALPAATRDRNQKRQASQAADALKQAAKSAKDTAENQLNAAKTALDAAKADQKAKKDARDIVKTALDAAIATKAQLDTLIATKPNVEKMLSQSSQLVEGSKENKQKAQKEFNAAKQTVQDFLEKCQAKGLTEQQCRQRPEFKALVEARNAKKKELDVATVALQRAEAALKVWSAKLEEIKKAETQLAGLQRTISAKRQELVAANQALQTAQQLVAQRTTIHTQKENLSDAALADFNQKKEAARVAKNAFDQAKALVVSLEAQKAGHESSIAALTKKIQDATALITNKKQKLDTQVAELAQVEQRITTLTNRLSRLANERASLDTQIADLDNRRRDARRRLIDKVLTANRSGSNTGIGHGSYEGKQLAEDLGSRYGHNDGSRDGHQAGESAGRARDFEIGRVEGYEVGKARGIQLGNQNGTTQGTIDGNTIAATNEGTAAGVTRAQQSDAQTQGVSAGTKLGLEDADRDGNANGTPQGEREAIEAYENKSLPTVEVQGAFAGTFDAQVPNYPGSTNMYYDDSGHQGYQHPFVQAAYQDGYQYGYYNWSESEYYRLVGDTYYPVYENSYAQSEAAAYAVEYQDSKSQGFNNGDAQGYDQFYSNTYNQAREEAKRQFTSNPNRSASEYKSTYKHVEEQTYTNEYKTIFETTKTATRSSVYRDNIAAVTDKYRIARFETVAGIYASTPVIKFESSDLEDGGLSGVAAKDGVFMPGEDIIHNVTIANYSDIAATGIRVNLASGEQVTLPSLPAGSRAVVKGAVKSKMNTGRAGTGTKTSMAMNLSLSAEQRIQGRHFQNASRGIVIAGVDKSIRAEYPLTVSNLKTNGQVILGSESSLSASISSRATRALEGPLKITITDTAKGNIVTQNFQDLGRVTTSGTTLKGAKVLVNDERDVFTDVNISVKIEKNGVLLGSTQGGLSVMPLISYVEKTGAPIIVMDSYEEIGMLKDVLASLGGAPAVSILDLKLNPRNQNLLDKGLDGRKLVLINDYRKSLNTSIMRSLETSKNSTFLLMDRDDNSLESLKNSESLKDASAHAFKITGLGQFEVVRPNSATQRKYKNMNHLTQVRETRSIQAALEFAGLLNLGHEGVLDKLKTQTDAQSIVLDRNAEVRKMIELVNLYAIEDILMVSEEHKDAGIFKRIGVAKSLRNEDKYINKLINEAKDKERDTRAKGVLNALYQIVGAGMNAATDDNKEIRDSLSGVDIINSVNNIKDNANSEVRSYFKKAVSSEFAEQVKDASEKFAPIEITR